MNNYFVFLDYLELRRRIEKRLAKTRWLMLHTLLFMVVIIAWVSYVTNANIQFSIYGATYDYYAPESFFMAAWSVLLLLHGLRTYSQSGASASRREEAVENQIRDRLDKDDSYLTTNRRHLFRLHGLLEDDVQKRASLIPVLLAFGVLNAAGWVLWAANYIFVSSQNSTHYVWIADSFLSGCFIFVLLLQSWRRARHNANMRRLIPESIQTMSDESADYEPENALDLGDDGELIEFHPASLNGKKKRG